jgi:hypothetical protein
MASSYALPLEDTDGIDNCGHEKELFGAFDFTVGARDTDHRQRLGYLQASHDL